MPENVNMQAREDNLTVPQLSTECNADQGSECPGSRRKLEPHAVRLLQVITIVALEIQLKCPL